MSKNLKSIINTIVFLGIGVALLFWAFKDIDGSQLLSEFKKVNYGFVALAFLCGIISHLSRSMRWLILIEPMGYKAKGTHSFYAVIIGYLVNMAVPRLGEITRPALLSKLAKIPFDKLVGTVLVERVVDLIITMLITIAILFLQYDLISETLSQQLPQDFSINFPIIFGALLAVVILVYLVIKNFKTLLKIGIINKLYVFALGMLDGVKSISNLNKPVLFIFHSLLIWGMYLGMPYFTLQAFGATAHLGMATALTVLLFGTIAIIIPVPGGIGTFHYIVPMALAIYGINGTDGLTYATLTHAIQLIIIFVLGIFSLISVWLIQLKTKKHG